MDLARRVPAKHPVCKIRQLVNEVLVSLDAEFAKLYSAFGRESIPPGRLLRALLLQALFTIRSERQLMEQPLAHKEVSKLLSDAHFSVDGTLFEAWAVDEELPAEARAGWRPRQDA